MDRAMSDKSKAPTKPAEARTGASRSPESGRQSPPPALPAEAATRQALSQIEPLQGGAVGSSPQNQLPTAATVATAATGSMSAPAATGTMAPAALAEGTMDFEPLWEDLAPAGTARNALPPELVQQAKADGERDGARERTADGGARVELRDDSGNPAQLPKPAPIERIERTPPAPSERIERTPPAPSGRSERTPPAPSQPPPVEAPPRLEPGKPAAYPGFEDLRDIQGLVYHSWADHPFAGYQFAKLGDAAKARAWLAQLLPQLTSSVGYHGAVGRVQLALSPRGLHALGVPERVVAQLPHEARAGMRDRARVLGDEVPTSWSLGDRDELEVLVMVFAADAEARAAMVEEQRAALEAAGATLSPVELSAPMPEQREHFGFVDGISQPFIHGLHPGPRAGRDVVAAGEIVLGYPNEYDRLPHSPHWDDFDLGRNGSYLVFRKLEQHVERFWGYLTETARAMTPDEPEQVPAQAERLAAKMMGRWRSGAPLALAPDRDDPAAATPEKINTFGYREDDRDGLRCPISAHVRRANPRDTHNTSAEASLKVIARHRILRRGRAFGPPLDEALARAGVGDQQPRGLYFICLQTSIARGFEFIQQTWLNNPGFGRLNGERDPLTGAGCPFTIPADPVRLRLPKLPRFVTTRGGGYFFLPSLSALTRISREP